MTIERIEDMREVVLPFVKKRLLETNYENLGESDAEMFAEDFDEILNLAIKALGQEPTTKNNLAHNLCDLCANIGCEFQSGIVRTECAFYMPPQLEPDNCGNYVVQDTTTKNDLGVDCIKKSDAINIIQDMHGLARADIISDAVNRIITMLSVTAQTRKGHWIKIGDRGFGYSDIVICKCSECEHQTEFVGKFDGHNLVIDAERADNYCPNCGAEMSEVEE